MVATRRAEVNPAEDGRGREPGEPNDDGASIEQSKDDDHDPTLEGLTEEGKRLILETRRMKRVGIKKGGDSDIDKALKKFLWTVVTHPYTRVALAIFSVIFAILLTMTKAMVENELTPPYNTDDITHRRYQGDEPRADVAKMHNDLVFVADLRAHTLYKDTDISKRHEDKCGYWTCERSHVDIPRLVEGNMGLQVFASVTDLPYRYNEQGCAKWSTWFCAPNLKLNRDGGTYDMMSLISFVNGWPISSWFNRFPRAWSMARKLMPYSSDEYRDRDLFMIFDKTSLVTYYNARRLCLQFRDMDEETRALNERKLKSLGIKDRGDLGRKKFSVETLTNSSMTVTEEDERYDVLSQCKFTAGILAIEGALALEGDEYKLGDLHAQGYRILQIGHFRDNEAAGSLQGKTKGGLTDFGKALIIRSEIIGMVLDFAHLSDKALHQALELVKKPFFYSHTGAFGVNRNLLALPDKDIRAIARKGGVIGIGFYSDATGGTGVEDIVNNIKYVARVAGWEHVALGSGWDGRHAMPVGLDASGTWRITEQLMREGFSEEEIRAIMGENIMRVLVHSMKDPLKPGDVNPDMYKRYEVPEGRTLPGVDMSKLDYVTIYPEITDGDKEDDVDDDVDDEAAESSEE